MNIGVDITTFAQKHSGIQVHVKNVLDYLQQRDKENEYYLFEYVRSGYKITNPKWHLITKKKPRVLWSRTIWFQCIFPWLLKKHEINTLWSPDFFVPVFVSKKIKVILTIHDLTFIRFSETMDRNLLRRFRLYFPRSVKKANKIFTVSENIKKEVLTYIPASRKKQIIVSANGKPSWQLPQEYDAKKRDEFIFFPGNFEPRKNVISVIKGMELLIKEKMTIRLHLSGNPGWKNEKIYSYIQNSPIKENIVFLGYLSEQDLVKQYCNCKALIFPSLYEGFGMPVLEALYCDCMVITSKGTVMQDICGDAAIYFEPLDPRDIADKIKTIFSFDFDRNKYLCNRKVVLDRFDWRKTGEIIHHELTTSH